MNELQVLQRAGNFQVVCKKRDGCELAFQVYPDERVARAVAARLSEIGCPVRVRRVRPRREGDDGAAA